MSRRTELGEFERAAEWSDLFDGREFRQDKMMRRGLGKVAASGTMVGIVMPRQGMFMLFRLSTLIVVVARALGMMVMAGMLRGMMISMVFRPMRVSPGRKQAISQMQQDCTEGDEFEVLAEHRGYQY